MSVKSVSSLPVIPAGAPAKQILEISAESVEGRIALACSFSVEDIIIVDLVKRHGLPIGVFAIDTGRLNEETYEVADRVFERYGNIIEWYFPGKDAVERLEREKGLFSFRKSLAERHECCHIRKVEPLQRALSQLSGWVTGLRREQSVTRTELKPVEIDGLNGDILKVNPLIDWTGEQVLAYAKSRELPINKLFSQGYLSIGCAPCTRAIQPGEHARAGRWWWEKPEDKECGLHAR